MTEVRENEQEAIDYLTGRISNSGLLVAKNRTEWNERYFTKPIGAGGASAKLISSSSQPYIGKSCRMGSVLTLNYITNPGTSHGVVKVWFRSIFNNSGVSTLNLSTDVITSASGGLVTLVFSSVRNPYNPVTKRPPYVEYFMTTSSAITISVHQIDFSTY